MNAHTLRRHQGADEPLLTGNQEYIRPSSRILTPTRAVWVLWPSTAGWAC